MESDKWIRKLFALLVEMGFELQSPQSHRKVIYKGDKLKKPCSLVIQSHAKESSKRDIMSYIKRTLRAADAPPEMIERLSSFPIGFVADGMTIQQIDDALYDALQRYDKNLIAEIALELGRAIAEDNSNYQVKAFDKVNADTKNLDQLMGGFSSIRKLLVGIFEQALKDQLERHETFELHTSNFKPVTDRFDDDIHNKYSFRIIGIDKSDDVFTLNCQFTNDMANILSNGHLSNFFSVSFYGDEYEDGHTITSVHDIGRFSFTENYNISLDHLRDLEDQIKQEVVLIYLR